MASIGRTHTLIRISRPIREVLQEQNRQNEQLQVRLDRIEQQPGGLPSKGR